MVKIAYLQDYDAADYLTTKESILAYLSLVLEENDLGAFIEALSTVARAKRYERNCRENLHKP